MERLICVIIGYALGLIETGYFYGKLHHVCLLYTSKNQYDDKVKRVLSNWGLVKKLQSQTQE